LLCDEARERINKILGDQITGEGVIVYPEQEIFGGLGKD
jgi:hypothetical protein